MRLSHRIKAGIKYILNQYSNNGHVYVPRDKLLAAAYKLLEIPEELIENIELQVFKDIYQEKLEGVDVVYLSSFIIRR